MITLYPDPAVRKRPKATTSAKAVTPLVLGKPKRTIVLLLARYLFLRADQLCAAGFGRSLSFVRSQLIELTAAGWLLRAPYLRATDIGKAPYVYTLNTPGWEWVAEQGLPTPERFRPSEEVGKVSPHTEAIATFGVALERYCRRTPAVALAQFHHERVLPFTKIALPDGATRGIRPDAWIQLAIARENGCKQRCWVLEVDRASEFQRDFRDKIQRLLVYRKDAYRAQFGTESITILFTVPTPHRRKIITSYIEAEIASHEAQSGKQVRRDLFWITDVDPRAADADLFVAPCWHHPFQAEPARLLDARPTAAPDSREVAISAGFLGEQGMLRFYQNIGERPPMTALESDLGDIVD